MRIENESNTEKVGLAPDEDRQDETYLNWFGHIRRYPLDARMRSLEDERG